MITGNATNYLDRNKIPTAMRKRTTKKLEDDNIDYLADMWRPLKENKRTDKNKKPCSHASCNKEGTHKAPKGTILKGTDDYYYFCAKHIEEYNREWNFFNGMTEADVLREKKNAHYGNNPSWQFGDKDYTKRMYDKYMNGDCDEDMGGSYKEDRYNRRNRRKAKNTPAWRAGKLLGIEYPFTKDQLKKRYKQLVKKMHPDLNQDDANAEKKFKELQSSYELLKTFLE